MMLALAQNIHNLLSFFFFFFLHSHDKLWELFCLLFAVPPSRAYQYGFEAPSEKSLSHSCLKCKLGLFIFSHLIYLSLEILMAFFAPDHDSSTYLWNKAKKQETSIYLSPMSFTYIILSCWSCSQRQLSHCIALFPQFTEPMVGKAGAKRLEENARSCRNHRSSYSLLAGAAAIAADPLYSLLSWLNPTDTAMK